MAVYTFYKNAGPEPAERAWLAKCCLPLGLAVLVFIAIVPIAEARFRDLGVVLPAATRELIHARRSPIDWIVTAQRDNTAGTFTRIAKTLLKVVVFLVPTVLGIVGVCRPGRKVGTSLGCLGLLILGFEVVALSMPVFRLLQATQGSGP